MLNLTKQLKAIILVVITLVSAGIGTNAQAENVTNTEQVRGAGRRTARRTGRRTSRRTGRRQERRDDYNNNGTGQID